jgi:hypothetical protein
MLLLLLLPVMLPQAPVADCLAFPHMLETSAPKLLKNPFVLFTIDDEVEAGADCIIS